MLTATGTVAVRRRYFWSRATFDPGEIAKIVNEIAEKGTPMRHVQRCNGKSVPDGYVVSAGDGKRVDRCRSRCIGCR